MDNKEEVKVVKAKTKTRTRTRRSKEEILSDVPLMERLGMKFPERHVKKRMLMEADGNVKELSYLPGDKIIERLNTCFDGKWDFSIEDKIVDVHIGQVAILGRLEIIIDEKPVVKEQWGSAVVATFSNGKIINLGNDIKAATTDSLKKCATLLGVGLYLYAEDDERGQVGKDYVQPNSPQKEEKTESLRSAVSSDSSLATKAQVSSIMKIARDKEIDAQKIMAHYGVEKLAMMKKSDAANFIVNSTGIISTILQKEFTVEEAEEDSSSE